MKTEENKFFDINQFPNEEGIILYGVSMNRIGNEQSAEKTFEYLKLLDKKIVKTKGIGMVTLYADYLYFLSDEKSYILRDRNMDLMMQHKHGFLNLISKYNIWIEKAFSFYTFGQFMLENSEVYKSAFNKIMEIYKNDAEFQEYVKFDVEKANKNFSERGKVFILEEIVAFYLINKGKISFNNKFVQGIEKWTLQVYPGKCLKSEVYLFQLNPLKLSNSTNKYENCFYDLTNKVLYNYNNIDIKSFDFEEKDFLNIDYNQEKSNLKNIEIQEINQKGKGLIAKKSFKKDEVVFEIFGQVVNYATKYTIPLNEKEKVEPRINKSIAQYMNHSCDPNIYPSKDGIKYIAINDIQKGEELNTNYAFLGFNFGEEKTIDGSELDKVDTKCNCNSKSCKGRILAYNDLSEEEKAKYKNYVLPFLKKKNKILGIF